MNPLMVLFQGITSAISANSAQQMADATQTQLDIGISNDVTNSYKGQVSAALKSVEYWAGKLNGKTTSKKYQTNLQTANSKLSNLQTQEQTVTSECSTMTSNENTQVSNDSQFGQSFAQLTSAVVQMLQTVGQALLS